MEGEQKRPNSGGTNVKLVETGKVNPKGTADAPMARAVGVPASDTSRVVVLGALADGIDVPIDRWLGEVLKAALSRFAKMPRDGWQQCQSIFCDKSQSSMPLADFQSKTNFFITSNAGRSYTYRKYVVESAKRTKTIDAHFEKATLGEAKISQKIRLRFNRLMMRNLASEIDKAKMTRKFTNEEADKRVLNYID